ncbi:hypothetical protein [Variovorax paradoxus]|uniref:hypothetical protein n=1 Tax=Variovorax paradoxus TaxID=34073 RepID=UPI003D64630B
METIIRSFRTASHALSMAKGRFRLMASAFELPAIDVQLRWRRRFENDAGLNWLRGVVVELFDGYDEVGASSSR